LLLNTGRIRDQWHSMARSGRSARLASHLPEPFVDMHPADAACFGLGEGALVRVTTRWGGVVVRLRVSGEIARGSIFVPIHWSTPNASNARIGALMSPAVDPVSGEPEFKCTPARVEPFVVSWYGFALTRRRLTVDRFSWWACAEGGQFQRYEIAGRRVPRDWSQWAQSLFGADPTADWIEYDDASAGTYRAVHLEEEKLQSCLFIAPRPVRLSRSWLSALFDMPRISAADRACLLAGTPADGAADSGATVCACFNVGRTAIAKVVAQGCHDPGSIGKQLKAGTQCGSCVPELRRIIADALATPA
jgi:assimilatory nitrate reductase catalytic subunit